MSRYTEVGTNRYNEQETKLKIIPVIRDSVIALAILIGGLIFNPIRIVPVGSRGVLTQMGAIKGIEAEGPHLVAPWQRIDIFSIRAEESTINNASGSTADQQKVDTDLTVRYSVMPDKVAEVYEQYSHNGDLSTFVETATQEVFKAVTARYTAPELISKRAEVSVAISDALGIKLAKYGARVINIDMRNFDWSKDYAAAINDKVTQEQKRQAAENKAKTTQAEQQANVFIAEAAAKVTRTGADAAAYQTKVNAEAQADALKLLNAAVSQNKDVLELKRIEVEYAKATKWNGALPQNIYAGTPIPFFNVKD